MSESFPRPKDVPHYDSFTKFVRAGRGVVFILGSDSTCFKLNIDPGRRKGQKLVYYTSRALRGAEGRYPLIEKLAFALITTSRKLRHYFQAHVINVMTNHPLKKAMNKLEGLLSLVSLTLGINQGT